MCRFLSWDFEYRVECPVDRVPRTVRVQSFPYPGEEKIELSRSGESCPPDIPGDTQNPTK